ncbi:MAG: ABC transporter ATP-binding protein [Faecousia sp.]
MNIIETKNLTKYYGKHRGIENVTFQVQEGEIFGFIGPNGAGKSTTIRTLLSLIHKTSGEATIFGLDCQRDSREILKQVGYLPSEVFYYDKMKAIDLLTYSASFYSGDCTKRIRELAWRLELDLNKRVEDMSLGNKKKVGIIQGLLHSPKLIILDEPTSGLDPLMQRTFFDLIREENQRGATVLFSSHILGEVQRMCHRVAIIKDGTIAAIQDMEALRDNACKKVTVLTRDGSFRPETLPGAADISRSGKECSFLYRGDCGRLLTALAGCNVVNIDISEPSLEEIFLHYYS